MDFNCVKQISVLDYLGLKGKLYEKYDYDDVHDAYDPSEEQGLLVLKLKIIARVFPELFY